MVSNIFFRYFTLLFCTFLPYIANSQSVDKIISNKNWNLKQIGGIIICDAKIPGSVHTALLANQLIENPFFGNNESATQFIESSDWEYKTDFELSDKELKMNNIRLVLNQIDTYADVFLNESLILQTNNTFRRWEADVKQFLKKKNSLRIYFHSTLKIADSLFQKLPVALEGCCRVMVRKPAFHFGWDWAPKLVPTGIYQPISLQMWNQNRFEDFFIEQTKLADKQADLNAIFEISSSFDMPATLAVQYNSLKSTLAIQLKKGTHMYQFPFLIKSPNRWWPAGMGTPYLYKITAQVQTKTEILELSQSVGLRTIKLTENTDKFGSSFYFEINGKPIFAKGANYVPMDIFQNRVSSAQYRKIIHDALDQNCNMLRVWGGGQYECDEFYAACDSAGIMVWQDFMFACALYPANEDFIENIKNEATQQVKRLRKFACIALWCGNNEIDEAWHNWGWAKNYDKADSMRIWNDYLNLFHKLLPEIVQKYDSYKPYHASSPQYGRGNARSQFVGDSHYWGVWHDGEPFSMYEKKVPRFMSEFGFQSFPEMSTIDSFALKNQQFSTSKTMLAHQKHPRGNFLIEKYMNESYSIPESFEDFVYKSQLLQAEAVITGIEAQRRSRPYCMGSLYWQLNDCWPAVSWSAIDFYGNKKALYYAVKKAFAPVMISLEEKNDSLLIYSVSDLA